MAKIKLTTTYKKLLADTVTPVSIYLKLRDKYENPILLESSDYHGNENSFSYICCEPLARFEVKDGQFRQSLPGAGETSGTVAGKEAQQRLSDFAGAFETEGHEFKFINNGLFGYIGYDAVQYFENIPVPEGKPDQYGIPDILYHVYRYVIAIDHFKNELFIFEHSPEGETTKGLAPIENLVNNKNYPSYSFVTTDEEASNYNDQEFLEMIDKGMQHCFRGDVFQIVLSRRFQSGFKGDEFNVYRALRSVNPSPYLFYFDYGSFKIFGSSPEAQLVIKDRKATIHPIAGTFRRTGNDAADAKLAKELHDDPKENSEHVMLVDLARNDLSRAGSNVVVDTYKEIQYFSHVIHLVSKVTGTLRAEMESTEMVSGTFPAGTLSGAPKVRAMQLINDYETTRRGTYGGAIGFMGFNGDFNHAIMIRSFLSLKNTLYYQAGAGVVAKSNRESELQEVNNKLAALRKAIELAREIYQVWIQGYQLIVIRMSIKNFTELETWKKARVLRKEVSELSKSFPVEEKYCLVDQMIRSARSVTANIAEGYGRFHHLENTQFCRVARGSLTETLNHLIIAFDEGYINENILNPFEAKLEECIRILNGYMNYLQKAKKRPDNQ